MVNIRMLIRDAIKQFTLPIAANGRGYYTIGTNDDLIKYEENLHKRINGIEQRLWQVIKNYNAQKGIILEPTADIYDEDIDQDEENEI
jgi:hypothetical protein